ncbi:NuoM homolog [Aeropyrum pernix K1]|uniref:NuoM homolog n=1 Tax=Aeropyrum pernix (strain ATCC 700893 / DSM 11879 / JCM 9820 / NBRC 100138 / K1) TaxID=272557 RepID=Q9YC36_AERPE|nr:complex I subunit 5 family protein [Aeropyrum pernix]BAA80412.1 NuoM homolog [Aeropyrum pernix K1]
MELGFPLLWLSLVLPVLASLTIVALPPRTAYWLVAITLAIPGIVSSYYAFQGVLSEGIIDPVSLNLSNIGIGVVALAVDGFSYPFVLGVSVVTALVAVYGYKYMEVRLREMEGEGERAPGHAAYLILYSIFSSTMLGIAYSLNFLLFIIFLELSLLSSFLLIAFYGYGDRRRIALLYFVWTHIAGALALLGGLYYVIKTGTFDVATVEGGRIVYFSSPADRSVYAAIAGVSLLLGMLVKMAVFGVHMWLPYAHAEAPTPISALLSPNLIGLGGYGIARFAAAFYPWLLEDLKPLLVGLAFVTIVYGGLVALSQLDFKRLLAYSSISQMGYMLLALSTLHPLGFAAASLIFLGHAVGKAVLFMTAGVFITEAHGLRNIARMGGLARLYPLTAAAALIGFLHLAGIPPAFGFWGELYLTLSVLNYPGYSDAVSLGLLAIILIVAFTVTAAYSFITMRRIFFGRPRADMDAREEVDGFKSTVVLLAVLGVALFLLAGPMVTDLAASSLAMVEAFLS